MQFAANRNGNSHENEARDCFTMESITGSMEYRRSSGLYQVLDAQMLRLFTGQYLAGARYRRGLIDGRYVCLVL